MQEPRSGKVQRVALLVRDRHKSHLFPPPLRHCEPCHLSPTPQGLPGLCPDARRCRGEAHGHFLLTSQIRGQWALSEHRSLPSSPANGVGNEEHTVPEHFVISGLPLSHFCLPPSSPFTPKTPVLPQLRPGSGAAFLQSQQKRNPSRFSWLKLSPDWGDCEKPEVGKPGGGSELSPLPPQPWRCPAAAPHLHEAPEWMERAVQQQRGPATATAQHQVPEEHLGPQRPLERPTVRGARLGSGGRSASTIAAAHRHTYQPRGSWHAPHSLTPWPAESALSLQPAHSPTFRALTSRPRHTPRISACTLARTRTLPEPRATYRARPTQLVLTLNILQIRRAPRTLRAPSQAQSCTTHGRPCILVDSACPASHATCTLSPGWPHCAHRKTRTSVRTALAVPRAPITPSSPPAPLQRLRPPPRATAPADPLLGEGRSALTPWRLFPHRRTAPI